MTERDLVLEARALKSELKEDRTSAFCKAVTHIAVTAKTENLISAMADEIERLHKHIADLNHDLDCAVKECNERHG